MATREVPKADWQPFAQGFSRLHDGWIISLQILEPDLGAQIELVNRPFRGLVYEPRDEMLMILSSDRRGDHLCHQIMNPRRIFVEEDCGEDRALEIESDDGTRTVVQFRDRPLVDTTPPSSNKNCEL